MKKNVLFVVENDFFPRDMRVYNEARTIANKNNFNCIILAPKGKNEKLVEIIDKKIKCYRFPHFDSSSKIGFLFEYCNAAFWIFIYSLFISIKHRIKIIHIANPPDFIIPTIAYLKLFRVKIIFDQHDLSVETLKGKLNFNNKNMLLKFIFFILSLLEKISIHLSTIIISTNETIKNHTELISKKKKIFVVRNSNSIKYNNLNDICKTKNKALHLGYFGIVGNDFASGYMNLIKIGKYLKEQKVNFLFSIIGDGPGLGLLRNKVKALELQEHYLFEGFLPLEKGLKKIIHFDFGILPWPDIPKNNIHTAMKIMDYMCCGVPVCSLKLKEQMFSTGGIGIHTENFERMTKKIIKIHSNNEQYEKLRKHTLDHFNNNLAWDIQKQKLLEAYECII